MSYGEKVPNPYLSDDGCREGAVVVDPAIDAGLCGSRAISLCAIAKGWSPLGRSKAEARFGSSLLVQGQPGPQTSIFAEVGTGGWAAVVSGNSSGEVLQGVVGSHQQQGSNHHGDLDQLEASDAPHLFQEVIEGHGAGPD